MKRQQRKQTNGFTIVELVIVVAIIAILVALVIVGYGMVQRNTVEAGMKTDLKQSISQLEIDKNATGGSNYPNTLALGNFGNGISPSDGNLYQYTETDSEFCLSVQSEQFQDSAFHYDSSVERIEDGLCPGHSLALVSTFAGSSSGFQEGNGTNARFSIPHDMDFDSQGNLYVADYGNHRVRKITPSGDVSTFAGSGTASFGDGAALSAHINRPSGLVVDSNDNVYVSDFTNRIRKITQNGSGGGGTVSTFAGTGATGNNNGPGATATFYYPNGMGIDSADNLYVADEYNGCIRKITQAQVVSTLSGLCDVYTESYAEGDATTARFDAPYDVAVDSAGNAYVADGDNHRIRKITPTGDTSTLAGNNNIGWADGNGASATLGFPGGVIVGSDNNVYFTEYVGNKIRKITMSGDVTTIAGSVYGYVDGYGAAAFFRNPRAVAMDGNGDLFIADQYNNRIRKIVLP